MCVFLQALMDVSDESIPPHNLRNFTEVGALGTEQRGRRNQRTVEWLVRVQAEGATATDTAATPLAGTATKKVRLIPAPVSGRAPAAPIRCLRSHMEEKE